MEKIKGNFGFGCMRLPMQGEEVDLAQFSQMVDEYLAAGFNCFDTARVYLGGKSEPACPVFPPWFGLFTKSRWNGRAAACYNREK